jgi:hypothetical protein
MTVPRPPDARTVILAAGEPPLTVRSVSA